MIDLFMRANRFDKKSMLEAVLKLEDNDGWFEIKTYTYTGRVFLSREDHIYYVKIENMSGYVECSGARVELNQLLNVSFMTDSDVREVSDE